MNGTPRLRSAYPSSPNSTLQDGRFSRASETAMQPGLQNEITNHAPDIASNSPMIPLNILDAPTQRLYISAFYLALTAWRFYDYFELVSDESDSLWLFMKWVAMDGVFLYGLPALRIPWLQWSSFTMTMVFLVHAVANGVLMFRIPIPLETWLMALVKVLYDRELAVSERRVKPASLLHNSSLILGKQIIHILPEGSSMLNPENEPLCIDLLRPSVRLPIFINQTSPISIELLRIDLESNLNETITISSKQARKLKKLADREFGKKDTASPRVLRYPVKQTGLYRLIKVVDESSLEVQRGISDTLVVQCPSASIQAASRDKCRGELSDFYIQLDATPPLKIKYSKTVNNEDQSSVFLSVHPESLDTPLAQKQTSGAPIKFTTGEVNMSWARTQHIDIPVNETLGIAGGWRYSIEEIHDGCGNVVNYTQSDEFNSNRAPKRIGLEQVFLVHERPRIALDQCSLQNPIMVAKGRAKRLPFWFNPTGQYDSGSGQYHISYSYTSQVEETANGAVGTEIKHTEVTISPSDRGPEIYDTGIYAINSVSTDFCSGEVLEPSSCLLLNPPEPNLSIASETIPHNCAGNSIGLRVSFDLIGTPPFVISYSSQRQGGSTDRRNEIVNSLRTQLEFKPRDAGHYTYEFLEITDAVYSAPRSLKHKQLKLEQDVRPTAWARFTSSSPRKSACFQEPVSFDINLTGEAPWILEYDIVHDGKRQKYKIKDITTDLYTLTTPSLIKGGQYSLTLTSVMDASACRIVLDQEAKIEVRHQRPTAAFGNIEGQRSAFALEGKRLDLPVRLSGEGPWTVTYSKLGEPGRPLRRKRMISTNDFIEADSQDTYRITEIYDKTCPGSIDNKANQFEVLWIARPTMRLSESQSVFDQGGQSTKQAVCEGDQDVVEIALAGNPPFLLRYEVYGKPSRGLTWKSRRQETVGLHSSSIKMETIEAGHYEYSFSELSDRLYEHENRRFSPLVLHQEVNSRPSATFADASKVYSFCRERRLGEEAIPISLVGKPPFSLEMGIRHHGTAKPEVVRIPNIENNHYSFLIPPRSLSLGTHSVTIRKVRDANGCQEISESGGPTIRVNMVDVPTISPMESISDFCVGDRISFALAGTPPFSVFYIFEGINHKVGSSTTTFRRLADKPGNFTITAVSDKASTDSCRAPIKITKMIHELPSVRISRGRTAEIDIHEGGEAELLFEFGGSPPFEFTYTRSTNAGKGKRSAILETKSDVSNEFTKSIRVSEEGTYEVVAIRDRFCGATSHTTTPSKNRQQLLTFG